MSGEPSTSNSFMMEQKETKNGLSRHAQSSMTIGSKPGGAKKLTIKNFKCEFISLALVAERCLFWLLVISDFVMK